MSISGNYFKNDFILCDLSHTFVLHLIPKYLFVLSAFYSFNPVGKDEQIFHVFSQEICIEAGINFTRIFGIGRPCVSGG